MAPTANMVLEQQKSQFISLFSLHLWLTGRSIAVFAQVRREESPGNTEHPTS